MTVKVTITVEDTNKAEQIVNVLIDAVEEDKLDFLFDVHVSENE